ncbi:MAG: hypothetical protein AABX71_00920 [Nanoarchaeota archaeon]
MKKRGRIIFLILFLSLILINLVSAFSFSDFLDKIKSITGKAVEDGCIIDKNQCQKVILEDKSWFWECNGNQVTQKMFDSTEHSFLIPDNGGGPYFLKDRIIWVMREKKYSSDSGGYSVYTYTAIYSNSICGDTTSIKRISQIATSARGSAVATNLIREDRIETIFPPPVTTEYYLYLDKQSERVVWRYVEGRLVNSKWQYTNVINSNSIYGDESTIIDLSRKVTKDKIDLIGQEIKNNRVIWYEMVTGTVYYSIKDYYYNCLTGGIPKLIIKNVSSIWMTGDTASWKQGSLTLNKTLDKCTCTEGVCCNPETNIFYTDKKCGEELKETFCQQVFRGTDCGGKIMERYETRFCSGDSSECTGEVKTETREIQKCQWDEKCIQASCVKDTICENEVLRLVSPLDGEEASDVDEFSWAPGLYSTFNIYISNSTNFIKPIKCKTLRLPVTETTLEKCWRSILRKYPAGDYYWKIEASAIDISRKKIIDFTEPRVFNMKKPVAPSIVYPEIYGAQSVEISLQNLYWNPGIYNKNFKVQISNSTDFIIKRELAVRAGENFLNLTRYSITMYTLGKSGDVLYWRVYGTDKYNLRIKRYSEIGSFVLP